MRCHIFRLKALFWNQAFHLVLLGLAPPALSSRISHRTARDTESWHVRLPAKCWQVLLCWTTPCIVHFLISLHKLQILKFCSVLNQTVKQVWPSALRQYYCDAAEQSRVVDELYFCREHKKIVENWIFSPSLKSRLWNNFCCLRHR